jgi:hypothetical protein
MKKFFFLIVSVVFVSCNTTRINRPSQKSWFTPYDAIIVPGVPYYPDSVSDILQLRIRWSIYMYKSGYTKNIIYSGADVYSPYCESKIMAMIAKKNGIPANVIFCDTIAQHGTENIYYGYLLGKKYGFNRIALCTDPIQAEMLSFFMAKMRRKFKIKGGIDNMDIMLSEIRDIQLDLDNIPDSLAKNPKHIPIYKTQTRAEIFFGSLGRNIVWPN